jgi:HlyD family secretion protein
MNRPSFSRIILPGLAVLGIIVAAILIFRSQPNRSAETPAISPPTTPLAQREGGTVAGAGAVEPSSELVDIGTPIGGVVEDVMVQAGDRVVPGQPLFRIDTRDARAAVSEAAARLESARAGAAAARASLRVADNQLALYRGVSDPRAVSRLEVVDREGARSNARAQVTLADAQARAASAELQRVQTDLGRRTVRAPFAGQLLQVKIRKGEFAAAGPGPSGTQEALMTMGSVDPLHVRIDVDEDEIDRIDMGQNAVITARGDAGRKVTAAFVRAEPQVVPKRSLTNSANERVDVRVLQLIYALPSEGHNMFVGQQVDAFIPARKGSAK